MSSLKYIFLFLFISLALSQNETNTSQPPNSTNDEIPINDDDVEELNETLNNSSTHKRPQYDKNRPFNLTYEEMDTMIFCTFVIQDTLREKKSDIEKIQKRLNLSSPNQVYEKLGTDMFEKCNKNADVNLVNKYVINLTYFDNFKMEKSFKSLSDLDFDKYNNISDLALTMEQQILMYKYQSVEEIFRQKRADQRDTVDNANTNKIKIGNFDIDNIPSPIKFGSLLIVLILIFGGIFYFLKKLEKKPKDKKKNKKKKTQ
jgi:hypothetical protein